MRIEKCEMTTESYQLLATGFFGCGLEIFNLDWAMAYGAQGFHYRKFESEELNSYEHTT